MGRATVYLLPLASLLVRRAASQAVIASACDQLVTNIQACTPPVTGSTFSVALEDIVACICTNANYETYTTCSADPSFATFTTTVPNLNFGTTAGFQQACTYLAADAASTSADTNGGTLQDDATAIANFQGTLSTNPTNTGDVTNEDSIGSLINTLIAAGSVDAITAEQVLGLTGVTLTTTILPTSTSTTAIVAAPTTTTPAPVTSTDAVASTVTETASSSEASVAYSIISSVPVPIQTKSTNVFTGDAQKRSASAFGLAILFGAVGLAAL
ncbi:uncharacterized protein L969DRAFT_86506 [Mixia osmundae IAM 14324]|uniref:Extracellular membrane protein CFEM domain-containing protein n=1 Tax=Mixia osmundae (strain CBS 9802 / IAM 14324 / JCM 22182 / KY 12970) TaxID=764103 RepID=G7E9F9_MIXOS|nr:uncharacterized protein L969DRAFT_86506 [Mixia osmundae IAM 14324]KEI39911.1 hypothetical protein L969DRAFT_86506 [Mixia osmundae IAM 14324]GAA99278.1 hypothetical protein E5Q_05973 [Mixia osmundae IAM 14324]